MQQEYLTRDLIQLIGGGWVREGFLEVVTLTLKEILKVEGAERKGADGLRIGRWPHPEPGIS